MPARVDGETARQMRHNVDLTTQTRGARMMLLKWQDPSPKSQLPQRQPVLVRQLTNCPLPIHLHRLPLDCGMGLSLNDVVVIVGETQGASPLVVAKVVYHLMQPVQ
jgi:hypothetical protein